MDFLAGDPLALLPSLTQFKCTSHLNELGSFNSAKSKNDNNLLEFKAISLVSSLSFH